MQMINISAVVALAIATVMIAAPGAQVSNRAQKHRSPAA